MTHCLPVEWRDRLEAVAQQLAASAAERDARGGTAWAERQLLRDSGLLTLAVPRRFGGQEAAWPDILRAVRRLAQADSSLAHLFGFQHLQVATVLLFGSPDQQASHLGATVSEGWFWGNAVNARDTRLQVHASPDGHVLEGAKAFCSGAQGSDVLVVSVALGPQPAQRLFAVVPTARRGVVVHDDWDNLGQRQTDSGTVSFDRVLVRHDEVLGPPGAASSPRATLRNLIGQLVLTEIYLGNAWGALHEAIAYMREHVQPWAIARADSALDDPVMQLSAGGQWVRLRAATALADEALVRFQAAWELGAGLTWDQRAALAMDIAAARIQAGEAALDVTAQIFELVGARATARRHGFDRYWRNVRVHTLHDPLDHRRQAVGRWLLTGALPDPYSYG